MSRKLIIVLTSVAFSIIAILSLPHVYAEVVSVTVDLQTILLEPNQIIPLLDTKSVGNMSKLQISATLPCDNNNVPKLKIFAGALGNLVSVIDSSNDYKNLRGPFNTCYYEDTISPSSNVPVLNKVFLNNTASSSVVTNFGSVITISGFINETNTSGPLDEGSPNLLYSTDFSSSSGWTQVGTTVSITGGVLQRSGNVVDDRVYHGFGQTLSENYWKTEYKWVTDAYINTGWAEKIMLISAGNSAQKSANSQDAIFVYNDNGAFQNRQYLCYQDGVTENCSSSLSISSGTVYPRLERLSTTQVKYEIFSDSARTASSGSVTLTIPNTVSGLNTVMSQSDGGSHHYDVDDLSVYN